MTPFVQELAARLGYPARQTKSPELPSIELVPTTLCFSKDSGKISIDRRIRAWVGAKSIQLRVVAIAVRIAGKHLFREEPFAP